MQLEGWRETTLGALCDAGEATIQTGPFGSQLHSYDYTPTGALVIATEGIGCRRILDEGLPRVPAEIVARLQRHVLRAGDILFARRGAQATGLSALVTSRHEGSICGTGAILLRVTGPKINPTFLSFFLSQPSTIAWLKSHAVGAVMPNINEGVLRLLPVTLPPLFAQDAIAGVLDAFDRKLEVNRELSETLEMMGRKMFRSWFVEFDPTRAPAATNATGPRPSSLHDVPAGWSRRPLVEWVDALSGGTPSKASADLWGGDIPWISPKVMTEIHADDADDFVTKAAIGNGTRLAPRESTLIMVRGMGLHEHVRVSQARREVTFNQDVKALVPRTIQPSLLLFAMLDAQSELLGRVESSGHGTGKLPSEILLAHPIAMPAAEVQTQLAKPFDSINDRIALARDESRTLASLRDLLLPRLISGELRIRDVESAVEAVA